ncbi:MarR family transcriptional regulator [Clostridium polyendosporum]|uniref:MarR family transcriptional regulator n=2 Tax=Clostridium polyendosporum TaxID=69208 RepID=A0A919RYY9_9CLOT|nr:MarR family transcriptional regulator [Clostridium polyendosporum]
MKMDESMGFILNVTTRKFLQLLSLKFSLYDITTEQWSLLNLLEDYNGISQKDLAKRSEKDPANVTRILDQLERKGLIKRIPNLEDRRSFLAYITDEGIELNKKLIPIEHDVVNIALNNLSDEKIALLRESLKEITTNINNYTND